MEPFSSTPANIHIVELLPGESQAGIQPVHDRARVHRSGARLTDGLTDLEQGIVQSLVDSISSSCRVEMLVKLYCEDSLERSSQVAAHTFEHNNIRNIVVTRVKKDIKDVVAKYVSFLLPGLVNCPIEEGRLDCDEGSWVVGGGPVGGCALAEELWVEAEEPWADN